MTVGIMVADCPLLSEAVVGDTEMETTVAGGTSDIDAVAVLVASAALVAVTVTVCAEVMLAGAVYTPPWRSALPIVLLRAKPWWAIP